MAEGEVIADGAPNDIRSDQKVIDAYQVQLAESGTLLLKSERRIQRWKWATFSTASVTILTTLILVIRD